MENTNRDTVYDAVPQYDWQIQMQTPKEPLLKITKSIQFMKCSMKAMSQYMLNKI